jgi:hypothetical protein
MTIKHLGDLIIWVGAVAAALTAIGGLFYWVAVRPFRRWLKEQINQTRGAVEAVQETAQAVHAEVTPNHGSSLKDAVTRTEVKVDALAQRFADHIDHHPGASA